MRSRLPLAAIFLAVLLASCGARPGVTVKIADEVVPTVLASTTEGTACSTSHGDAFAKNVPLTAVHVPPPPTLHFEAGQGATEIRGAVYDLDAPPGGPMEEFTLPGRSGTYEPRSIVPGGTYQILVNVRWSFVVTRREETHLFRLRLGP